MKNIAISGWSGFVGSSFIERKREKYRIVLLDRDLLYGSAEELAGKLKGIDGLINLAGKQVVGRWSAKYRKEIYKSRINTTGNIVKAISMLDKPPEFMISASAIGIYKNEGMHTEESMSFAENFLAKVVHDWEREALRANEYDTKTSIIRMGVVMGKGGGMFKKIKTLFRIGLGAVPGNGKQGFSFVHIDDVVEVIDWLINRKKSGGIYNLTAPESMTYEEFAYSLGKSYNKDVWLKIPGFILRIIYGKGAITLLEGQHVVPERLIKEGYKFHYPGLKDILADITGISSENRI